MLGLLVSKCIFILLRVATHEELPGRDEDYLRFKDPYRPEGLSVWRRVDRSNGGLFNRIGNLP